MYELFELKRVVDSILGYISGFPIPLLQYGTCIFSEVPNSKADAVAAVLRDKGFPAVVSRLEGARFGSSEVEVGMPTRPELSA